MTGLLVTCHVTRPLLYSHLQSITILLNCKLFGGLTAKGFLVMLNKEADKTLLHSPLKLDCDRRKRTTISLTLSLNKHYNASVANWMWALIIYFPFFTRAHAFPFSYIFQGHFKVTVQSVSLFEIQLPCFTYSLARDLK